MGRTKQGWPTLGLAVVLGLVLTGCGGGGGGDSTADSMDGSGDSVVTTGVITGFGSVYVNGVRYDTRGASVDKEGVSASEQDLAVGMVVTVQGTVAADGSGGTASHISYKDEVEGPVSATTIPAGGRSGTLTVLGQTVTVTADTVFERGSSALTGPDQLVPGMVVEVSGYPDGSGGIYATRLEFKAQAATGRELEVKGRIQNLDRSRYTFRIGSLTVDYSGARAPANLADGQEVEVKSYQAPQSDGAGGYRLAASEVELEDDDEAIGVGSAGSKIEMSGVVSAANAQDGSFTMNGYTFRVRNTYECQVGSLAAGVRIKVEGYLDTASGTVAVEECEFQHGSEQEVEGIVEAIDAAGQTIIVRGMTLHVTSTTLLRDEQDEGGMVPEHYFSLASLRVGDYVECDYYTDGSGQRIAVRLERDDDSGRDSDAGRDDDDDDDDD